MLSHKAQLCASYCARAITLQNKTLNHQPSTIKALNSTKQWDCPGNHLQIDTTTMNTTSMNNTTNTVTNRYTYALSHIMKHVS